MKDSSYRDNKRPANNPTRQNTFKENFRKHFELTKLAIILAAFSICAAIFISTFSYQRTINDTLNQHLIFYSKIAGMIAADIGENLNMPDKEIVYSIERKWKKIKNRPSDEYLCIVNEDSKLLLHTSIPSSVGNIVAKNLILNKAEQKYCSLGDLVKEQKEYVGEYISSSGDAQIAAFEPVTQKQWIVGVHRSKEDLLKEINSALKSVFFSLIIICSTLIPISFALLFWAFIACYRKGIHADQALTDFEISYRAIVDGTDDLITQVDANGLFTFVNHASNKIWGLSPKDCIGLSAFDLIHPDDRESTKKAFEGWISQKLKRATYQNRQVNKDGQIFEMLWTINFDFNAAGEVVSVLNIAHDITEQKDAERRTFKSEENYRILFNEMLSGFAQSEIICDSQGRPINSRYMVINPAFERIVGVKAEKVVGKTILEVFPNLEPEWLEKFGRVALTGKSEHFVAFASDTGIWFDVLAFCPAPNQYACTFFDITARKKAEQEITELNKNLEKLVKERTLKLEAVNAELDAFNYSVSHDLRAPIRSMEGFSKILLKNNENTLNEESKDHLNRIIKGAARMKDLVDSLLKISRISRRDLVKNKINISDLATNIFKTLRSDHPERLINVVIEKDLFLYGDKKLFNIALENLIDNAWKFTSKVTDPRIELGSIKSESGVIFFIKDNGCGFDMEYADKIFIAFQRLHNKNEYPGIGIGLATVKRIMNLHGSKTWVKSELNKSTTFYFELPGA